METSDYLVIGAGISGLLCATELQRAGKRVTVLDKGRGYGGRMATRRMAGGRLDHGAQFFTVRHADFQSYVDEWLAAGKIKEWFRHQAGDTESVGHPRYCGVSGMTDVPKFLAESLTVHCSQQVVALTKSAEGWTADTAAGQRFSARYLISTAPLPQSVALMDTAGLDWSGESNEALRDVKYEKGLATLVVLDGPSGVVSPGGLKVNAAPLTWIGDNTQKGISPGVHTMTLHADADFSAEHWDSPDEIRGALMLEAAKPYLNASVVEYNCHRWGFTRPINPWADMSFHHPELSFSLAGDAFGGKRVEGAALSGIATARDLIG